MPSSAREAPWLIVKPGSLLKIFEPARGIAIAVFHQLSSIDALRRQHYANCHAQQAFVPAIGGTISKISKHCQR
jgi:hypothetical protein